MPVGNRGSRAMCTIRVPEADDPRRLERARSAAENLNGVVKSEANHIVQMLTVEYDPERTTWETIRKVVK